MELRKEFIKRMKKVQKEPAIRIEDIWKFFMDEE